LFERRALELELDVRFCERFLRDLLFLAVVARVVVVVVVVLGV
jgi:hypothetical protein